MYTLEGYSVNILREENISITETLKNNRHIENERIFFDPLITDLHDPYLMPDMEKSVYRILEALEKKERIVIFGDYDVDGVSSTAMLVRFLSEIGGEISYRLPHRVHDGYGLKSYFFDELAEKNVKLVITVDCGTRDIEPIKHAKSLGIDVIITDHHAVPDVIPTEVIGIINPKRKDSIYPFPNLAGAGVAFKLIHGILIAMNHDSGFINNSVGEMYNTLTKYIDLASLGTVADCMPLVGENRIITALGLKQMKNSESAGLRKFLEGNEKVEGNADIIGFQIGPRINASGRMDTPLTALRWLLASEERCDEFLSEIESLNQTRQEVVKSFSEKALEKANPDDGILFFMDTDDGSFQKQEGQGRKNFSKGVYTTTNDGEKFASDDEIRSFSKLPKLEHGLIGLIAGKLTEAYNRPSIVLCDGHSTMNREQGTENNEQRTMNREQTLGNREYEKTINTGIMTKAQNEENSEMGVRGEGTVGAEMRNSESMSEANSERVGLPLETFGTFGYKSTKSGVGKEKETLVASCRSPEWCNLVELLDACKGFFVRYGGHRQAAGFTIERNNLESFQKEITRIFHEKYGKKELPKKTITVENIIDPKNLTLASVDALSSFRPFGIGNPKPLWLLKDITILSTQPLGQDGKHLSIYIAEKPETKLILWNAEKAISHLTPGNILSLIIELDENEWHGKKSVQVLVRNIVL